MTTKNAHLNKTTCIFIYRVILL